MSGPPLVLSVVGDDDLADAVAAAGGFERGEVERQDFPDGERYRRLVTEVLHRDVVVVGATASDAATLELYDLACAASKYGARSLTLVIPYLGYSTMERATRPGEVVVAKTRARLLSSVPPADAGNRVLLVDLHSEGLPHYFEGGVTPVHVYAKPLIMDAARRHGGEDFVLASTDAGRAKWVQSLANDLGVDAAFVLKRRRSGTETEVLAVSASVEGRTVVLFDDMIRTGGSLRKAAEVYRAAGAARVVALATHGVLPGDSLARLQASGLFERIVVTDTHPRARALAGEDLEVLSVAPLLAEHLRRNLP